MKRISFLLIIAAFLVSCNSKKITDQQKSFQDKKWQQGHNLIYTFNITDTSARYDISAGVKYFENFPFDRVQLAFELADPSGEKRMTEHDLVIRNKEGRFLGTRIKDTLSMNFAIRNKYRFKAVGLAQITLINRLPYTITEGLGGISIKVRKR